MQMTELQKLMKECGVVGAGGAGFPSYAKLSESADTVILNCAECEPLFRLHRQLMSVYTEELLTMLDTVRTAVGAKNAIVAIKSVYTEAIERIDEYISSFEHVKVAHLPEIYPAGDEIILIYEATGRVVKPGQLPISEGVIVYNVETMLNTYFAMTENTPVCYKFVTVAGEVNNPGTYRVPIGTPLKALVDLSGGEKSQDCEYLSGGAMMGSLVKKTDCVTKTTNAVLVLPKNHPVIMKKKTSTKINIYRAMSACCQCRMCTDMCTRNLLGHPIEPHAFMRAVSKGMTSDAPAILNTVYCSQCRVCEMYACQQGLSPASLIGAFRNELRAKGVMSDIEPKFKDVNEYRKYRTIPMERLISRLGISEYNVEAPIRDIPDNFAEKCKTLKIKLRQHIGQPAKPVVKQGDKIEKYQKLASCEGLGAEIHSPCKGKVKNIKDDCIIIEVGV